VNVPFSVASVAFTNTIARIICLLVQAALIGLLWIRRRGFAEIDIAMQT
jgi:hypothetical protein